MYDLAFAFWSNLTTEQSNLPGGLALAQTGVPYFLSNAAWYPKAGELKSITEWYAARDLPPAIIVSGLRDEELGRALQDGPFMLEKSFHFRTAETGSNNTNSFVEQVNWSQSRYAAELLADFYEQPELKFAVAKSFTAALQTEPKIYLFLAYNEDPIGMMVTFERGDTLSAMLLVDTDTDLETRLIQEAEIRGLSPLVLEVLPKNTTLRAGQGLERWSIY